MFTAGENACGVSSPVKLKDAQNFCSNDKIIINYIIPEKPDKYQRPLAVVISGSAAGAFELNPSYKTEPSELIIPLEKSIPAGTKRIVIAGGKTLEPVDFSKIRTSDGSLLAEKFIIENALSASAAVKNTGK
jgi:hypothetical protein